MSGILAGIPKLRGREDYATWRFSVRAYLKTEGLWKIVAGTETEADVVTRAAMDIQAKSLLILLVEQQNYAHIQDEHSAKGVWAKLKAAFGDSSLLRRVAIVRTLCTTKLDDCDSMRDFVGKIMANSHKLRGSGMMLSDEWIGTLLLAGLSVRYKSMIVAIDNAGAPVTVDQIKAKLLQEVENGDADGETSSFEGNNGRKFYKSGMKTEQETKLAKCFKCGKGGHFKRDCKSNV